MIDYKAGDYVAYKDQNIVILWRPYQLQHWLYMFSAINGDSMGALRNPELDHTEEADYTAADWAEAYYIDHPQKELAL